MARQLAAEDWWVVVVYSSYSIGDVGWWGGGGADVGRAGRQMFRSSS